VSPTGSEAPLRQLPKPLEIEQLPFRQNPVIQAGSEERTGHQPSPWVDRRGI